MCSQKHCVTPAPRWGLRPGRVPVQGVSEPVVRQNRTDNDRQPAFGYDSVQGFPAPEGAGVHRLLGSEGRGMSATPHYRLPWPIAVGLGVDVVSGRPRSFVNDCTAMVRQMRPRPRVTGIEYIPSAGPFVLLANHYEGPGLWIGWPAALLTHAIAQVRPGPTPVHWLVIGAMDRRRVAGVKRYAPGTGWFFGRVARTWEMIPMPRPAAPAPHRATALRALIRTAAPPPSGRGLPVALFPEGEGDGFAGLRQPLPGTGALLGALARRGVPALPAGIWSADGRLHARFGPPWSPAGADAAVRSQITQRLAALTPLSVLGERDGVLTG